MIFFDIFDPKSKFLKRYPIEHTHTNLLRYQNLRNSLWFAGAFDLGVIFVVVSGI
jgi:hypothetical protein